MCYSNEFLRGLLVIVLDIGADGFQFTKNGKRTGWPIIGYIVGSGLDPFIIGLYVGDEKPKSVDDLMRPLFQELDKIKRVGGIKIISANETRLVPVEVFIADSPARAYLTSTKGHMGSYGCHRCNALQKKYNYPPTEGEESTDSTFNDRLHVDHHSDDYRVKKYLLEEYKYKMVTQFPIDGMHALDQGLGKLTVKAVVQKKIKKGSMDHEKVPSECERHGTYKDCAPSLFSRKPRPLSDFGKFKATEFRQFLLYTGLVLMKDLLTTSGYYHFLCLSLGYVL